MSLKFRFIAFVESKTRNDSKTPTCKVGNKLCGQRCVPAKSKCSAEKDDVYENNAMTLYRDYNFDQAAKDMAKLNPKMGLAKAKQYHRDIAQAIVRNMWEDGKDPNKAILSVNKKYGFK